MAERKYHNRTIPRGVVGEVSKIQEEVLELLDAEEQGLKIMQALEVSDILGACKCYVEENLKGISFDDCLAMMNKNNVVMANVSSQHEEEEAPLGRS